MIIRDIMTTGVKTCQAEDSLLVAAKIMWDGDCGCVPVVDDETRVVGIITDRDVCMAALTQGVSLSSGRVASAMARDVECIYSDESPALAEAAMQRRQVRRLPVLDRAGRLVGIVSLADIAFAMESAVTFGADGMTWTALARTLAAVSRPRSIKPRPVMEEARRESEPPASSIVFSLDPLGAAAESF
jgi:CBS domain-containing protein